DPGTEILAVNTHFDHTGKEARLRSAEMLRKNIPALAGALPVMLTGDFNTTRDDPPYQALMKSGAYELMQPAPSPAPPTFCASGVFSPQECVPTDCIFLGRHWQHTSYAVLTTSDGRDSPSDHLPVLVSVRLGGR